MYNGKMYKLTPKEEKVAMLYAKRLVSEEGENITVYHTKDATFNRNFWKDFKTYLTPEHKKIFKIFKKIGWRNLKRKVEALKEEKASETKAEVKTRKDKGRRKEEKVWLC